MSTGSWSTWLGGTGSRAGPVPRELQVEHLNIHRSGKQTMHSQGAGGKARLGVILIYVSGILYFPDLYSCQYSNSLGFKYLNVSKTLHRCSGLSG